jgi:hypothetical protein
MKINTDQQVLCYVSEYRPAQDKAVNHSTNNITCLFYKRNYSYQFLFKPSYIHSTKSSPMLAYIFLLCSFYAFAAVQYRSRFFWDIAPSTVVGNVLKQRDSLTFEGTSDTAPEQPNHRKDIIKLYTCTAFYKMQVRLTASPVFILHYHIFLSYATRKKIGNTALNTISSYRREKQINTKQLRAMCFT